MSALACRFARHPVSVVEIIPRKLYTSERYLGCDRRDRSVFVRHRVCANTIASENEAALTDPRGCIVAIPSSDSEAIKPSTNSLIEGLRDLARISSEGDRCSTGLRSERQQGKMRRSE
jgi:hypothetical protein